MNHQTYVSALKHNCNVNDSIRHITLAAFMLILRGQNAHACLKLLIRKNADR